MSILALSGHVTNDVTWSRSWPQNFWAVISP